MLRENYFEEKFSIDALNTQKSEVTSIMNVNVIPYEVINKTKVGYIYLIISRWKELDLQQDVLSVREDLKRKELWCLIVDIHTMQDIAQSLTVTLVRFAALSMPSLVKWF